MLSELMTKKLTRHFNFRDLDKDGFVEREDWETCARNLAAVRRWDKDSAEYQLVLDRHLAMWRTFWRPADTNGDGKVSLAEYLALAGRQRQQSFKDELALISSLFGSIFDIVDLDADGQISDEEYAIYFQAWGMDDKLAGEAFGELDFSGDGYISRSTFIQFGSNFFMSEEEGVMGNKLFGALE